MPNWMQNIGDRMREAVMAKRGGFNPGPAQEGMGDKVEMMGGGGGGFVDPRGGINPGGGIGMMEPKGGGFISPIVNPRGGINPGAEMMKPNAAPFSAAPAPAMAQPGMAQPRPNMGMAPRPMAAPRPPMGGGRPAQNPGAMRLKRRMGMF